MKKWLLGNEENVRRKSTFWNALGGGLNACQASIILIFISRAYDLEIAGMVTIGYAIANFLWQFAKYGMRNFQVTDVSEEFSFGDYFYTRVISTVLALLAAVFYLFLRARIQGDELIKSLIIGAIILIRLEDAFADVFLSRYQQKGRLDIGARIMMVRLVISTALICAIVSCGGGICAALLAAFFAASAVDFALIRITAEGYGLSPGKANGTSIGTLMKRCLPLCVCLVLSLYIDNAPKYTIDSYMNDETQAIFGYIMLPVFVITLLSQFLYQPVVKDMGDLWAAENIKGFLSKIRNQCFIIAGLLAFVLALGLTIGLPLLSWMYDVDLTGYKAEFSILLIGGALGALGRYLNVPLTAMRRQAAMAIGYIAATAAALISGGYFVTGGGMLGAGLMYLLINSILVIVLVIMLIGGISRRKMV